MVVSPTRKANDNIKLTIASGSPEMTNPAKTLWWETFELWDMVLYHVGNVYYKARRPHKKRPSQSRTRRTRRQRHVNYYDR